MSNATASNATASNATASNPPVSDVVAGLRRRGVLLWADGGALAYDAPAGVMTPAVLATLAGRKADVLALLRAEQAGGAGPSVSSPIAAWAAAVVRLVTPDPGLRADVMYVFGERAGVLEFDGGLGRADAERQALGAALAELASHPKHCPRPGITDGMFD